MVVEFFFGSDQTLNFSKNLGFRWCWLTFFAVVTSNQKPMHGWNLESSVLSNFFIGNNFILQIFRKWRKNLPTGDMRHVTHDMLHVKRDTAHMKPNFFLLLFFLFFTELPFRVIQSRNRDVTLSVCLFVSKVLIGDYAQRVGVHYNINNVCDIMKCLKEHKSCTIASNVKASISWHIFLKTLNTKYKPYYFYFKKSKVRLINYKKSSLGTLMKDIGHWNCKFC